MTATATPWLIEKKGRSKEMLYTADDYDRMTPPDSGNYELHNGKLIFMASPLFIHQELSANLHYWLMDYVIKNKSGKALAAPMDVYFDENNVVQPDLLYISNERLSIIENNRKIKGSPDLVVEILSNSNKPKEMSFKKHLFECFDVREYWLINLEKQTLIQYENSEDGWLPHPTLTINDTLKSIVLRNFELKLTDIF
jgi:Uma2 family endonuclease